MLNDAYFVLNNNFINGSLVHINVLLFLVQLLFYFAKEV